MIEMDYVPRWEMKLLHDATYEGYYYAIVSYGTHPCIYVRIPEGHELYGKPLDDGLIGVHGGVTFMGELDVSVLEKGYYIGWDYSHTHDFTGHLLLPSLKDIDTSKRHRWTTAQLIIEAEEGVHQLVVLDKHMTPLQALAKLDHTICINYNEQRLAFNCDEFKSGPFGDSCDCDSLDEFFICYDIIKRALSEKSR